MFSTYKPKRFKRKMIGPMQDTPQPAKKQDNRPKAPQVVSQSAQPTTQNALQLQQKRSDRPVYSSRNQSRQQDRRPMQQSPKDDFSLRLNKKLELSQQSYKDNVGGDPVENKLKVMVLGGCEEVGRNMTVFEYGEDIVIVDMGLQFPEEDMPGIDYIIPNISYLKGKEKRIRGIMITHGHYDHIGAISHLVPELGNPPIYTARLTAGLIKQRHKEFKDVSELKIHEVNETTRVQLGKNFSVSFFHINHTIPDSFWVILDTPVGRVIHSGDFKFDHDPVMEKAVEIEEVKKLAKEKTIKLFMVDSTNAEKPGHQLSEGDVAKEIDSLFKELHGRIIVGTFASNLIRIQSLITISEKYGRKVMLEGRSMNNYAEVAHGLGLLKYKSGTIVEWEEGKKLPPERLCIICTGAQGEKNAVLMRIANNEHKYLTIHKGDTVLFSSSVIPGNERTIQNLRDGLTRAGVKVINYSMMDIHAGGHMKKEDLRELIQMTRPEYYMPIEANHYMLREHAEIAYEEGYPESKVIVADNGQVVEVTAQKAVLTNKRVPADYVFVDGLGVGDVSDIVLRDRRLMAADGMLVIICTIEKKNGQLIQNPDLISRGFIYMKENKALVEQTRNRVKKLLKDKDHKTPAFDEYIKTKIRNDIGQFLFGKTRRRPMILPVIIQV